MFTLEAIIDPEGSVHLLKPVHFPVSRRALVTILDEAPLTDGPEPAFLSERSLAEDWNRSEEDVAWAHLQSAPSS